MLIVTQNAGPIHFVCICVTANTMFEVVVDVNVHTSANASYEQCLNVTTYCFINLQPAKKQCLGVSSHAAGGSSTGTADKEPRVVRQPRPQGLDVVPGREACWDEMEESEAIRKKLTCGGYSEQGIRADVLWFSGMSFKF